MKEKRMAVIKNVKFGTRDTNRVLLYFDAYIEESVGSLQLIELKEAVKMIEENKISDISALEGKTCWVEVDMDARTGKFLSLTNI